MKTYRIAFDRIGRNHNVAPIEVTTDSINDLTLAIFRVARRNVVSREVDVVIDPHMTGGYVSCGGRNSGLFKLFQVVDPPVLDANGNVIEVSAGIEVSDVFRLFMAGRVPAECGHYIAQSEAHAGLTTCERCTDSRVGAGDQA